MAIVLGLWSVILEPGKTYTQETSRSGIQITNVSYGIEVTGSARTVVSMKYPDFVEPESDEDEDEEESEDEDGMPKMPEVITKETVLAILKPNVTEQVSINLTLVENVEMVEFTITGPNPVHLLGHYVSQEDVDQDPYSDSEYGSDDEEIDSDMEGMSGMLGEDSDEGEDDEERFEELKAEIKKASAVNPKKRAVEEVKEVEDADVSMSSTLSKNQKKKAAKKLKSEDGTAVAAPVVAAVAAKVEAPVVKKEVKIEAPKKAAPTSQTLAGGLVITDSKVGEGPAAKSGKKVGMRYIGKLDNGKVFDSNTKGAPLVFTLGRGEVIKGWDMGVAGMQVGGERKLVIPAALAYGKKGTQGIGPNSTLHFDVKLVTLK